MGGKSPPAKGFPLFPILDSFKAGPKEKAAAFISWLCHRKRLMLYFLEIPKK